MKNAWSLLVLFLFGVFAKGTGGSEDESLPCIPRDFGHSSFACVCNATYCDTLPQPSVPSEGEFLLYSSDINNNRFLKSTKSFNGNSYGENTAVTEDLTLDPDTTYQTVLGYGGAFTDSATANILSLSDGAQELLLRSYFSPSGIEYNLGRVNMGGCDFSWRLYSYDDVEGDVELTHFELQPEDTEFKIPIIKRALEMSEKNIKLIATPWSAPAWMKTNRDFYGMGKLLEEMYQPWADYFVRFFDSYTTNDVSFWGVTAQNEPINGNIPGFTFNCMGWTAETQRKWIVDNLGPTLEANGYSHLNLMIMDDQRFLLPGWAETVLNDTEAAKYVNGIAVHWYWDDYTSPEILTQTHNLFPDYFLLGTEACVGDKPLEASVAIGSWERLEKYAHDIIADFNNWVTGWIDWNLALDLQGGPNWADNFVDSPIIVNQIADEFYKNPMFYAMGHFSKFIQEGAVRIDLSPAQSKTLDTVAFKNPDDSFVIVMLNRSEEEVEVRVQVPERGTLMDTLEPRSLHTAYFI